MFNVNFTYLISILLPISLRKPKLTAYIRLYISYINKIYDEYVGYRALKMYEINFTGQVMYLQKKLRDTFGCQGILIEDGVLVIPFYLSNKTEQNLPVYVGNNFKQGHNYSLGEWIVFEGFWYEYISGGNGTNPDADNSAIKRGEYKFFLSNQSELSSQNDFIVKVPSQCYNEMSNDDFVKMKSIINYYKLVNKTYTIIPY